MPTEINGIMDRSLACCLGGGGGGGCFNTCGDILYIKKMHVNSVGHSRDEKILQLYTILVVPCAGIYVLEVFES